MGTILVSFINFQVERYLAFKISFIVEIFVQRHNNILPQYVYLICIMREYIVKYYDAFLFYNPSTSLHLFQK